MGSSRESLRKNKKAVAILHGQLPDSELAETVESFGRTASPLCLLIASDVAEAVNPFVAAGIGVLIYELLVYVWHRAMHRVHWIWRSFHQMHHSAERMDTYGAFYFRLRRDTPAM